MSPSDSTRASLSGTRPAGTHDETAASRQVREMFSRIAPRYDLLNHLLSLRFDVIWRKRLAHRFADILARPDARVLDLCCGTGDLALALADATTAYAASKSICLMGADFAHPMLVRAREKTAGTCRRLEFVEADALSLPFADATFDLVATAFGFRNLVNYAAGLRELRRVLAVGGALAILEFAEPRGALFRNLFRFYFHRVLPAVGAVVSGHAQAYSYLPESVARFPIPSELVELMERCGFGDVAFESWTSGIVTLHTGCAPP
ncbi:MAG: bifunctional demethylmenaquinone methyltransferase/2-methoxy-6-polyprenyl-1,4-benzoquinol methylase UbiE [Acidobacteria bacterium]|nr:MAG: bifunctional demethylmenaquinone methyltransferase/2-methoxy-6-polyprenyl-1,4-benzoquinol methylase UbiE [Acidobacteriota bacterium]